ncbi:MAG: hypothetical protein IKQ91_00765, partial [Oscillospiraceae bacterium]|nr:hypothetical protein [Oscillospiraceae bacterium]
MSIITYNTEKRNGRGRKKQVESIWEQKRMSALPAYNILYRKTQWERKKKASGTDMGAKKEAG